MGLLKNEFLATHSLKPLCHKRAHLAWYIDDIFMIWQYGEVQLLSFIHGNNAHQFISFSNTYSEQTINFLDVTLMMYDGWLTTKVYRKPADKQQCKTLQY